MLFRGTRSEETKRERIVYQFADKKLKEMESPGCHTWTKEKIICANNVAIPGGRKHETLHVDRLSGFVNAGGISGSKSDDSETIIEYTLEGPCQKIDRPSF
jgi:hypothetical protein